MSEQKKREANSLIPGDLFVPGEYIKDEMQARGMKQVELAEELGISKSELSLVLSGKRKINIMLALQLEKVFKIDAETWMNIQVKYDIEKVKIRLSNELETITLSHSKRTGLKKAIRVA